MTQPESARKGTISPQMEQVARQEGLDAEFIRHGGAQGKIVIPANIEHRNLVPCGIGQGLKTKVNANIGTSSDFGDIDTEMAKLRVAIVSKADTFMHLRTGGDIPATRRANIDSCPGPLGRVPTYSAVL